MTHHGIYGMVHAVLASLAHSVSISLIWLVCGSLVLKFSAKVILLTMIMIFSCHPVWILELLWSADDKLLERIVGYPSNISRYFGDVN